MNEPPFPGSRPSSARFRTWSLIFWPLLGQALLGPVAGPVVDDVVEPAPDPVAMPLASIFSDVCGVQQAWRYYDVLAVEVPISYNHWGDVDLHGRLFVLEEEWTPMLEQVAASLAEAGLAPLHQILKDPMAAIDQLRKFKVATQGPIDVSPLVRPLVVRAHLGDCVQFNLTNLLPEPASLHVHGVVSAPGAGQNLGNNLPDVLPPGATGAYRVYVPPLPGMEGAHFFHSHADPRYQTKHGLFGALAAEPPGSTWLAPDGTPSPSGDEAVIVQPGAADFREYVVIYQDEMEPVDRTLQTLPIVDQFFAYGPGTKGMNYRSEPFMRRFNLHNQLNAAGLVPTGHDKSQGYGSYTYGDPATFIPRAYVGDPSKFRLVNAGPGSHHVHHLHGGGDRWRYSPVADDTQFDAGLLKDNPIPVSASQRVDVQLLGPGESFNAEIEGGAGGTQGSVGDFLFHCHIVEHYLAGMWTFWRVLNTLQPDLAELPDRANRVPAAADSLGLLGRTMPDGTVLNAATVRTWVESQLPPRGVPGPDDASVWDWAMEETSGGPRYLGEPETTIEWPNYQSPTPGQRPALLFNPDDGRPSYPFLRPHFGQRPPFAPGHGPAPYLGPDVAAGRPDGLCPADARRLEYNVVALATPVTYNRYGDTDINGQIFALAEDKADLLSGAKVAKNLVLRANQGDCVDVLFSSQLKEASFGPSHSKANMHIHLVQFDVQGSDGVITGFNYEQSVRPAAASGTTLAAPAEAGSTTLDVVSASALRRGTVVGVGLTEPTLEPRRILAVEGSRVTLDHPLERDHGTGERVGVEFVKYRWYADVEVGTVYWHDHVDGLNSWRHGLYGALIVEPRGARWLDPVRTGDGPRRELREGTVADIVIPGRDRSFREFVVEIQDRTFCLPRPQSCLDLDDLVAPLSPERLMASFNLRSEPFRERNAASPLSNGAPLPRNPAEPQGEPATDLWRAYAGDPVVVRLLYGGQASTRAVNTFAVTGHRFPYEPGRTDARLVDAISLGISSQHTLKLECGAGGCARLPGDYLYHMTNPDLFWRGAWGVFRVHGERQGDLWPLPGAGAIKPGQIPDGPVRRYDVAALEADVVYNERFGLVKRTKLFALADEADEIAAGEIRPQPLVLRALPGEVVEVRLQNRLPTPVSFHASLLPAAPGGGLGIPVGENADEAVPPGATGTFRVWADRAVGAAHLTSFAGDAANATLEGLYGALVVEPEGASFDPPAGASSTLTLADGSRAREHVLLYASDDGMFEAGVMPYTVDVKGLVSVNYRTEPLNLRVGGQVTKPNGEKVGGMGVHPCQFDTQSCTMGSVRAAVEARNPRNAWALSSLAAGGDPETPLLDAVRGERLVVRALGGAGDQLQVHALDGHWWSADGTAGPGNLVAAQTLGPTEVVNAWIEEAGPGGAGDYLWGSHRGPFLEAGAWGLLRVHG